MMFFYKLRKLVCGPYFRIVLHAVNNAVWPATHLVIPFDLLTKTPTPAIKTSVCRAVRSGTSVDIENRLQLARAWDWLPNDSLLIHEDVHHDPLLLGQGSYGQVLLGSLVRTHMEPLAVAVKTFHGDVTRPDALAEADILRHLEDARIAPRLYGVCEGGKYAHGMPIIVMELLGGQIMNKFLLAPPPLTRGDWLDILRQITSGLHIMHTKRLLYNDLKIDNIMLLPKRYPKGKIYFKVMFFDFGTSTYNVGISYFLSPIERVRIGYLAPEVIDGEETTMASDIYSLGYIIRLVMEASGMHNELYYLVSATMKEDPAQRPDIKIIYNILYRLISWQEVYGEQPLGTWDIIKICEEIADQ